MSALGPVLPAAAPSAALRPYVTRLYASREHYAAPVTRSEPAFAGVVLVLAFGASLEAGGPGGC